MAVGWQGTEPGRPDCCMGGQGPASSERRDYCELMSIDHLAGRSYGPFSVAVTPQLVSAYVAATGDDPIRWTTFAPPSIASVALFAAAPEFLFGSDVGDYNRILLHADQTFEWHQPVRIGSELAVTATVDRIRERGGMAFVSFGASMVDHGGEPVISSSSTFIMSPEAPPASDAEQVEPDVHRRGDNQIVRPERMPAGGSAIAPVSKSASRADLVRYASASSDFNPIHWDHATARAGGLPRVICHGLLLAAWMFQAAGRHTDAPVPLSRASLRFKKPLLAGDSGRISGTVTAMDSTAAQVDMTLASAGEVCVTAQVRVTR